MSLDVTVLYFDGCPSWSTTLERMHTAAARAGVPVRVRALAVDTTKGADRLGFFGSPTILIEGRDPFSHPGAIPAFACRLYSTPAGLAGSPTVDQLVEALRHSAE